ncbi:MAG: hypothetical protein LBC84_03370 [Prevotellaceae bacterium]|jgi:rRNA maturation endonuclease Nob1|nr:hypothetical protein [Prevotellaceae bacterium]
MKTKFLLIIGFFFATAIVLGVYTYQNTSLESDLFVKNVEALSQNKGVIVYCFWRQVTCKKCGTQFEICDEEGDGYTCTPCGSRTRQCC